MRKSANDGCGPLDSQSIFCEWVEEFLASPIINPLQSSPRASAFIKGNQRVVSSFFPSQAIQLRLETPKRVFDYQSLFLLFYGLEMTTFRFRSLMKSSLTQIRALAAQLNVQWVGDKRNWHDKKAFSPLHRVCGSSSQATKKSMKNSWALTGWCLQSTPNTLL